MNSFNQTPIRLTRSALCAVGLFSCAFAQAITVPGSANPNLAGRSAGYSCCSGDTAPAQSPTEVTGVSFAPGDSLAFSVRGQVSYVPVVLPGNNPDGNEPGSLTNYGDGISAPISVRYNALYGVFLTAATPTGSATPAQLNFSAGLNFTALAPGVGQIFFIGDGLTSDTNLNDFSGTAQSFLVPVAATRLFLGTGDGVGWYNNSGSFDVSVKVVQQGGAVPVPSSIALLGLGLGSLALVRRRRR
jgi:hypothetical protein